MKTFNSFRLEILEATARSPYAIGTAQAMKSSGDKPPLEKSTIKKAHKIAKAIMRKEETHYCAKHVYSDIFGEGIVIEGEHAEPDSNGIIEWYTVKFDHGDEIIFTEDLDILIAEYHNNHNNKKKQLHPNQKKLDVASPKGKLTAADFAALRARRGQK